MLRDKAYQTHLLLMVLYTLFRLPGEEFDPSAWADDVETSMVGEGLRDRAVRELDDDELNRFEIVLEGSTLILDALLWNIAGKPRGSRRTWTQEETSALAKWLSAWKGKLPFKALVTTTQSTGNPMTLGGALASLSEGLAEIHNAFGVARRREIWVKDVVSDTFGVYRNPDLTVEDGCDAEGQILRVIAAGTLCQAVLSQLRTQA